MTLQRTRLQITMKGPLQTRRARVCVCMCVRLCLNHDPTARPDLICTARCFCGEYEPNDHVVENQQLPVLQHLEHAEMRLRGARTFFFGWFEGGEILFCPSSSHSVSHVHSWADCRTSANIPQTSALRLCNTVLRSVWAKRANGLSALCCICPVSVSLKIPHGNTIFTFIVLSEFVAVFL